jgi:hypothetical protein
MTRVLDRQIEVYNEAEGPGQLGPGPRRRSVESAIDVGVLLFDAAKNEVRRWQQDVLNWDDPRVLEQSRAYDRLYRVLHDTLGRLATEVTSLEAVGEVPENAERLRTALHELDGIVCFDLERVIQADRARREGRPARTTAEVRDEFRRRMGS